MVNTDVCITLGFSLRVKHEECVHIRQCLSCVHVRVFMCICVNVCIKLCACVSEYVCVCVMGQADPTDGLRGVQVASGSRERSLGDCISGASLTAYLSLSLIPQERAGRVSSCPPSNFALWDFR